MNHFYTLPLTPALRATLQRVAWHVLANAKGCDGRPLYELDHDERQDIVIMRDRARQGAEALEMERVVWLGFGLLVDIWCVNSDDVADRRAADELANLIDAMLCGEPSRVAAWAEQVVEVVAPVKARPMQKTLWS